MEDRHIDDSDMAQVHGNDEEISRLLDLQQPLAAGDRGLMESQPTDIEEASLAAFMSRAGGGLQGADTEDAELDAALQQAVPRDFDEVEDRLDGDEHVGFSEAMQENFDEPEFDGYSEGANEISETAMGIAPPKTQGLPLSDADVLHVARPARENSKEQSPSKPRGFMENAPEEEDEEQALNMADPPKPKDHVVQLDTAMAIKVVGKKGLIVRVGQSLTSEQESTNLKPGSIIKIYVQEGDRVRYGLIDGEGPVEGWVSIIRQDGSALLLEETDRTVIEAEEEVLEQERLLKEKQRREKEARERAQHRMEKEALKWEEDRLRQEMILAAEQEAQQQLESRLAAEMAPQQRLEELKEQVEAKARRPFEPDEDEEARPCRDEELVEAAEREARMRLEVRLKRAAEAETLAIQDKENYDREQDNRSLVETPDSIWVFVSPFGQTGRKYRPSVQQVYWRRIFYGAVQAAFVWDDMFFVAKEDGILAVCEWGEPWDGGYEDWGAIFKGEVQAAWVHKDVLYVVKKGGRVAATPMGTDWDGRLEDWGNSDIFKGSVQAAFVEGNRLYVIKDGKVAIENWNRQDWDGTVEEWGHLFPGSMKTAFVADGNLYVARMRDYAPWG